MTSDPTASLVLHVKALHAADENATQHSGLVGGSTAERRIMCPASYQSELLLPPELERESSTYADEGTALHNAIQYILDNDIKDIDSLIGMEFSGGESGAIYVIDDNLLDNALIPCLDFFDALSEELKEEGGLEFILEQRCRMPGIEGAFGTSDLIGCTQKRSVIIDWKFGVGKSVAASYIDDDGKERPNYQLMFYARAAAHMFPDMFGNGDPDWPVDLYIMQPRARGSDGMPTMFTVTIKQLEEFRMLLVARVVEAKDGVHPTRKRGDWCTFAKCKTVCPLHTAAARDLTKLNQLVESRKAGVLGGLDIDWAVAYGDMLTFADVVEALIGEIRAQAHTFMDAGNKIVDADGNELFKLVPKRPSNVYTDADGAIREAQKLAAVQKKALDVNLFYDKPELKSPAQFRSVIADVLMDGQTKKVREEKAKEWMKDFTANVSSGTTIAPIDDSRRAVFQTSEAMLALANKLGALSGQ